MDHPMIREIMQRGEPRESPFSLTFEEDEVEQDDDE